MTKQTMEEVAGWRPIETIGTLPEVGVKCLFWFRGRKEAVIDCLEDLSESEGGGVQAVYNYLDDYSHWMPLPQPPVKP